jgi:hypothetical protein
MPGSPCVLKRVNYFNGQLLTAADLIAEQEYHLNRWRRHNQWCHGWGVVGGLELTVTGGTVVVSPGMALDCAGDEVCLAAPAAVSLPTRVRTAAIRYVVLSALEELTDSRVVETSRLSLVAADPAAGHQSREGRCRVCGRSHGVTLGRLRRAGSRWSVDTRYRRCRASV